MKDISTVSVEIKKPIEIVELIGPGSQLRHAREAAGLSPMDIAKALHLTTAHIHKLENDDYKNTVGLMFERGYLRSYARMMHVSEEEIIHAFHSLGLQEAQVAAPTTLYSKPITNKQRHYVRWVTYLIGLGLFAVLIMWWQSQTHTLLSEDNKVMTQQELLNDRMSKELATQKTAPQQDAMEQHEVMVPRTEQQASTELQTPAVAAPQSATTRLSNAAESPAVAASQSAPTQLPNAAESSAPEMATAPKASRRHFLGTKPEHAAADPYNYAM